ncbi:hypothetical protein CY0110_16962 [Crocosphaera chwakensis CCY0110]|uniref:Uncharacterized protein n=1 Tax=Crocosphaera chwakensis CCY0110 TaxID=391612 RepID=A3II74_9CHRO|nr:hypothetical protein CY0110_16962 [Crocosphaera chwakensis CCY0110]
MAKHLEQLLHYNCLVDRRKSHALLLHSEIFYEEYYSLLKLVQSCQLVLEEYSHLLSRKRHITSL